MANECFDAGAPTVLCGDFNICPEALDTFDEQKNVGHVFHTEEERSRIQRLLDWGFVDVFREKFPDLQAFSWWDYRGGAFHRKPLLQPGLHPLLTGGQFSPGPGPALAQRSQVLS